MGTVQAVRWFVVHVCAALAAVFVVMIALALVVFGSTVALAAWKGGWRRSVRCVHREH
jgi:hypothetical protein